jgi:hypothetical protein
MFGLPPLPAGRSPRGGPGGPAGRLHCTAAAAACHRLSPHGTACGGGPDRWAHRQPGITTETESLRLRLRLRLSRSLRLSHAVTVPVRVCGGQQLGLLGAGPGRVSGSGRDQGLGEESPRPRGLGSRV